MDGVDRNKVLTPEERAARERLKNEFRQQQQRNNQIQELYRQREGAGRST